MAQAIVYSSFGDPDVLTLVDIPDPVAGPGEVVVRVEAVGVNPIDHKLRSGLRPSPEIEEPRRIGSDAAGIVTAVGEGVDGFRAGDPVVVFGATGTYATDLAVPVRSVQPRPASVTAAEGAALGVPVGTAYQALRSLGVRDGDTLLLHAGSGAVGQAAIQLAALWGARVIATASPERFDRVHDLGAEPVAYGEGLADRVRAAAPEGISVALDAAGTDEAIRTSLALAPAERIATLVRGWDAEGFGIRAFGGGAPHPLTPQQLAWRAEALPVALSLLASGAFSVERGPSFALGDAAAAHRAVEQGAAGKVILLP